MMLKSLRPLLLCCGLMLSTAAFSEQSNVRDIMQRPEPVNLPALGMPVGPYSHGVRHGDVLYTSGLTAFGTAAQSGDIAQQTREIFRQLALLAQQQQSGLDRLIRVTLFVSDLSEMELLRQTLFEIYGDHIPASALIKVDQLFSPDLKIEIEAMIAI